VSQDITLVPPADQLISSAPFQVQAIASSGLPVALSVVSGPATVSGMTVTLTGTPGTVTLQASQAGNVTYAAAQSLSVTFNVSATVTAPSITSVSPSASVTAGGNQTLWIAAAGTPPLSYQWAFNSSPISGATSATYVVTDAQTANSGSYTATVSNSAGSVTSAAVSLTVNSSSSGSAPAVTSAPVSITGESGGTIVLTVNGYSAFTGTLSVPPSSRSTLSVGGKSGSASASVDTITYQWFLNGTAIPGANSPIYVISNATPAVGSQYTCLISNNEGSVMTAPQTVNVIATPFPGRLINLSCRAQVENGANELITGFVIGGSGTSGSEPVLIRASGPSLTQFNVTGVLPDPELVLNAPSGVLASNKGWAGNTQIVATDSAVGAFAFISSSSLDSALIETLPGGQYTAQVSGASGDSGIALAEVYDATPSGVATASLPRLINISARIQVGSAGDILIAGFSIGGTTAKTVLIRASGPALTQLSVPGVLPDPKLQLFQSNSNGTSTLLETNIGWGGSSQITTIANQAGAFSWGTSATPDSAIIVTLQPGNYTAEVSGASGDTGVALVEVYEIQ